MLLISQTPLRQPGRRPEYRPIRHRVPAPIKWVRCRNRAPPCALPRMAHAATKAKHETPARQAAKVEQQSRKIADSAEELTHSSHQIESSADRTTRLAADRTILAAERTYAAWVRTGLFAL